MKVVFSLLLWLGLLGLACTACAPAPQPNPTPAPGPVSSATPSVSPPTTPSAPVITPSPDLSCQDLSHVYNPTRLQVLAPCAHGTGIIEIIRNEVDGDYHVLVHMDPTSLDPNGGHWVNDCNSTCVNGAEHGDLVTEPVCEHSISQPDAQAACRGYVNPQGPPPPVGSHVEVSGPWVLDTTHGWLEVHPATYRVLSGLSEPDIQD